MNNLDRIHPIKIPKDKQGNFVAYASGFLKGSREKWKQPIDGEVSKTEKDLQAIALINALIQRTIADMGISSHKGVMQPEQIHFLDKNGLKKLKEEHRWTLDSDGQYRSKEDIIVIDIEQFENNRSGLYALLLHEVLHYYSFGSFDAQINNLSVRRSGYTTYNTRRDFLAACREYPVGMFENLRCSS